jgi:uncharacterized membrane protein
LIGPSILYIFEVNPLWRDDHVKLALFAVLVLSVLFTSAIYLPRILNLKGNFLSSIYLFCICTAAIDTALSFSIFDVITFARWYYDKGEKYFQTTAGGDTKREKKIKKF